MKKLKPHTIWEAAAAIMLVVISVSVFIIVAAGISKTEIVNRQKGALLLENAIRKAAVSCYAVEGFYPESLDYLVSNYGIMVSDRYIVHYEVFASNIIPQITVVENGGNNG